MALSPTTAQGGAGRPVVCRRCNTYVTSSHHLVSRAYRGFRGKAALYRAVSDVTTARGPTTVQLMQTGAYTVRALTCAECRAYLGWVFTRAHEDTEAWKVDHAVLESSCVIEIGSLMITPGDDSDDEGTPSAAAAAPAPSPSPVPGFEDPALAPGHRRAHSSSHISWRKTLIKLGSATRLSGSASARASRAMEPPAWEMSA